MKIPMTFTLLFLIAQVVLAQNYIPKDLKTSRVLVIEYGYDDWDNQFLDSTNGQWLLKRYGKDLLYNNYKEALDEAVKTLQKRRVEIKVVDSKGSFDKRNFDYIFDYKEKVVNNHESLVFEKRIGGMFFENPKTNEKYEAIAPFKNSIRKAMRGSL